jgi:hypothetical protein
VVGVRRLMFPYLVVGMELLTWPHVD